MENFDFVSSRLVQVFGDKSELILLTASGDYIWRRFESDGGVSETPILASGDISALREVRRISEVEYRDRMLGGGVSVR